MKKLILSLFSIFLIFGLTGIVGAGHNANGLAGYWNLDEGTGSTALDSSGHLNNGVISGTVYMGSGAPVPSNLNSLDFDGIDDVVTIPDAAELDITGELSMSAWVKTSNSATQVLARKTFAYEIFIYNGHLGALLGNGTTWSAANIVEGTTLINDNGWHHVAMTYDDASNTLKLYVDGVLNATNAAYPVLLGANGYNVYLGAWNDGTGSGFYLDGGLDEVQIYNRVLDADEISILANTSNTLFVDDDGQVGFGSIDCESVGIGAYTTIQDAVDAASSGDTVQVCPGTYVEAVNVTKPLTLESTTLHGAIIRPSNNVNPGIYINTVDNVTVDGFEIDGTVGLIQTGISGLNSNYVTLTNNVIHDIKDSPANNAGLGIVLYGWDQGINNALIQGNTVYNTDHHGIWIGAHESDGSTPIVSNDNVIKGNTVYNSWQDPECGTIPEPCWGGAIGMDTASLSSIEGNYIYDTGGNQRDVMLINGAYDVSITGNTLLHSGLAEWTQPAIEHAACVGGYCAPSQNLTITNNTITATPDSGGDSLVVYLPDVGGTNSFSGNTLALAGTTPPPSFYSGLAFDGAATGNWAIQDNTFDGNNLALGGAGIRLYGGLPASSVININHNQIHGWDNGIKTSVLADAVLVTANRNSITANLLNGFLEGGSATPINATCNWWGNASGPGPVGPGLGDAVSANVDFTSWLITSDLDGPCEGPLSDVALTQSNPYNSTTSYNLVGTSHTATADIGVELSGVDILFVIDDANAQTGTSTTDALGIATFTYTGIISGTDTITACIDFDSSGTCDTGELTSNELTKYWLTKFVTGGGNIKVNGAVTWTFGGNIGLDADNNQIGSFELSDHENKVNYHFDTFLSIAFSDDNKTINFDASGRINGNGGSVDPVHFTIHDNGEGGKNKADTISTTDLPNDDDIPLNTLLNGGNFKVFVQ